MQYINSLYSFKIFFQLSSLLQITKLFWKLGNILSVFAPLVIFAFLKFKYSNFKLPSNIRCILLTFDISKSFKFNEVNEEQKENIASIFSTFDVSKFDKFKDINDEQL